VGGQPLPDRSSLKRSEQQSAVKEQYNLLREREQATADYETSLANLTEDYQRHKDKLRRDY